MITAETSANGDQPQPGTSDADESATSTPVMGRKRRVFRQFIQFGIVGASGFIVNQAVFVLSRKLSLSLWNIEVYDPFVNLLGSQFNLRWHHVFSIVAFVVANVWNFCLNRYWTFKGDHKNAWWKQLPVFMAVGSFGLLITLIVSTALVNPESPFALPDDIFDGSTGFRTKFYWGNFIGVVVAVPANFLFNKLWTFRGVKAKSEKASRLISPRDALTDEPMPSSKTTGGKPSKEN